MSFIESKITNPKLGIEVGSFVGNSAVFLGNFLKKHDGVLICIDTFLGDINMWFMSEFKTIMRKEDGNPKIFDLFLKRIIDNELENYVLPIRQTSIIAARMLKVLDYKIDFAYLDSAHESLETFTELALYYDILKHGGVLFGDDYNWPAVNADLNCFVKCMG